MTMYDSLSDVQNDLLQKKIIDLAGEVNHDMFIYVREALMRLTAKDSPEIEILISSKGGDCNHGLYIYDLLASYPGKTIGKVFGYAGSGAVTILQTCDERQAAENAEIIIHNPHNDELSKNSQKHDILRAERERHLASDREKMIRIYQRHTNQSREIVEKALYEAERMTAEEALKFGLIDKIIQPKKLQQERERTT